MHASPPPTKPRSRSGRRLALAAVLVGLGALAGLGATTGTDGTAAGRVEVVLTTEDLTFSEQELSLSAETIDLTLANLDAVTHTFTIVELDVDVVAGGGEVRSVTFDVKPGRYLFICTIPGHDTPGMRGELVIR